MTRFWQRRIAVIAVIVGVFILALYGLSFVIEQKIMSSNVALQAVLNIGLYSAVAGAVSLLVGIYTFFATHPEDLDENARLGYLAVLGAIITLIYMTGTVSSPFTLFWGAVALSAPFFGGWGVIPALLAAVGLPLLWALTGEIKYADAPVVAAIASAPVLFGYFIKPVRNTKAADTNEDRSYNALARELGQISSKSEVVINAIGEGVLAVNGQGIIELINPAAIQLIGWGENDAVGLSYKSVLKLVDSRGIEIDPAHDPVAGTFSTNTATGPGEYALMTQSEKTILVSVLVSPLGQPGSGAIIVFRNVTNEKAEERQQAEFISTASHEMRTPVAAIEGYLGLALNPQTAQIDAKARDFITKAHESAQLLGRLFQDLLDVAKAEDGRMQSNPKVVDVTKFMADIVEGLQPKADKKSLKLVFKPFAAGMGDMHEKGVGRTISPVFYANVDNDHLREVGDNLVENAIKYTPSGEVAVDVTGDDQHVTISIADTGLGIPREDQVHLFQKFYRVDNSETREIGGTGLGLYLCRRLVEAMNGRVWVESTFKKGSTFYVELPRMSSNEADLIMQQTEQQAEKNIDSPPTPTLDTPPQPSVLPPDVLVASIANAKPTAEASLAPSIFLDQPTQPEQPSQPPVAQPAPTPQVFQQVTAAEPFLTTIPDTPAQAPPIPRPIPNFPNVQLSAIEKDPARYIAQTEGRALSIPTRKP